MQRKRFVFNPRVPSMCVREGLLPVCLFLCVTLSSWCLRTSAVRWVWTLQAPICVWVTADSSRSSPNLWASAARRWANSSGSFWLQRNRADFFQAPGLALGVLSKHLVMSAGVGSHSRCSHAPTGMCCCEDRRHRGSGSPKGNGKSTDNGIIKHLDSQGNRDIKKNTTWMRVCLRISQIDRMPLFLFWEQNLFSLLWTLNVVMQVWPLRAKHHVPSAASVI